MQPLDPPPRPRRHRTSSAPILLCRLAQDGSEIEVPIDVEVVTPPPADAPEGFRERLALALGTTDARLLDAAERGYQGTWPSIQEFIVERLALAPGPQFSELLASRDPAELRRLYEGDQRLVWSIAVTESQCMVFELPRASSRATAIAALLQAPKPASEPSEAPALAS